MSQPTREIPAHVPPELVQPYPLIMGATTYDDPFKTIIPAMHKGPPVIYSPGAWSGIQDAWIFRREEDVRAIFMDTDHFSSEDFAPFSGMVGEDWGVLPVEADIPAHRGYRNVLSPLFTPTKVAAIDKEVRHYAQHYIDQFRQQGHCDVMADFAARFPVAVFLEIFGLPLDEVDQFMAWEFDLLHNPDMEVLADAVRAVKKRLMAEVNARKRDPKDDIITHIAQAQTEGRDLTDDEMFGICFNLFLGGLDTVTTNIAWQLRHLANDTVLQQTLREDPSLIPGAVEEMLRAYSAVAIARTCIKETRLCGVTVMPGDKVMLSTSLGSNDPEAYEDPTEVKLNRKLRHLGFGTGIHSCVGLRLARRELIVALEEFLKAIPTFKLAPDAKIRTHLGGVMLQEQVPLIWTPVA